MSEIRRRTLKEIQSELKALEVSLKHHSEAEQHLEMLESLKGRVADLLTLNNPKISFIVQMPDGEIIAHRNAKETSVAVIEKLGVALIDSLGIAVGDIPFISEYDTFYRTETKSGEYYILSDIKNGLKKLFLEEIADSLGINIVVEIADRQHSDVNNN